MTIVLGSSPFRRSGGEVNKKEAAKLMTASLYFSTLSTLSILSTRSTS